MKRSALLILAIISGALYIGCASSTSWKFAVFGDSRAVDSDNNGLGVAADTLRILVRDIVSQRVDLVVFPGDMTDGASDSSMLGQGYSSWKSVMRPLNAAGIPVYTIRGNHENEPSVEGAGSIYLNSFPLPRGATTPDGGYTYSFTHKNAKFIGFDQYIGRKSSFDDHLYSSHSNEGQMMDSWVVPQINRSTSPLNFVFAHEMLFPSKTHHDCMANDPDSRDALIAALGTHNGTYLCAHDHMYLRGTALDGHGHAVVELVVGTAGGGNYDYAPFNARGYTGPDTFAVNKVLGNSSRPYFGYVLITVYDNSTWTGEFRGIRYDAAAKGKPNGARPMRDLDVFRISAAKRPS